MEVLVQTNPDRGTRAQMGGHTNGETHACTYNELTLTLISELDLDRGLTSTNRHVKYKSSITYHSKVVASL